jgi:hypothetical protein
MMAGTHRWAFAAVVGLAEVHLQRLLNQAATAVSQRAVLVAADHPIAQSAAQPDQAEQGAVALSS